MAVTPIPSPHLSPDYKSWAESSYKDFEERYKISNTTPMPLIR